LEIPTSSGPAVSIALNLVINGKEEWTITITPENEIIVMHKDESLA
jgi:hypothetical protein